MSPTITAFERSPDGGQGLARDMRVRWALEEVGQDFEVTRERIRQIEAKALRKLRHPSRAKKLQAFVDSGPQSGPITG